MNRLMLAAGLAFSGFAAVPALAEWPNDKPIEIIVGFSAGGAQDTFIRAIQPFLEKELGATLVVSNKPGAGGEIAYTTVAQAEPDGYTFSNISVPSYLAIQISRDVAFDPALIAPVARLAYEPVVVGVHQDSPFKTFEDFVTAAKAAPGTVTYAGSGVGTDDHLAAMLLGKDEGIKVKYVPFSGGGDALTALLGRHIQTAATSANVYAREPSIRPLVTLGEERSNLIPDTPTGRELGYDVVMMSERGFATNANVPEEIRARFSAAVKAVLETPEFQEQLKMLNMNAAYKDGPEWAASLENARISYQAIWDASPWATN